MATVIYEIPNSVKEMFEQGENSYRIIDYSIQEMDNIQSMRYFLDCIGATTDNIETDDGTQVVIIHPDFGHKLLIDSGGLGDFHSHGYDVTLYSAKAAEATVKDSLTVQPPPYNRGIPTVEQVHDDVEIWVFVDDDGFARPHWALINASTLRSWADAGTNYRNALWLPINAIPLPKE